MSATRSFNTRKQPSLIVKLKVRIESPAKRVLDDLDGDVEQLAR